VEASGTLTDDAAVTACGAWPVDEPAPEAVLVDAAGVLLEDDVVGGRLELCPEVVGAGEATVTDKVFEAIATVGDPRYIAEMTCVPGVAGKVSDTVATPSDPSAVTKEVPPSCTWSEPPATGWPFAVTSIV